MATRFYINNSAALFVPATTKGAWDAVPSARAFMMGTTKFGNLITSVGESEAVATAPYSTLILRGVSSKLQAQTIAGHLDVAFGVSEQFSSAGDFFWHLHVWVTQGDTDVVRGTLLNNYLENSTNEWPSGWPNPPATALQAPPNLTSVNALAGDRIIVELGFVSRNISTNNITGIIYYGTQIGNIFNPADDLITGDTAVNTKAGYLDFDQTILFAPVQEAIIHQVVQSVDVTPATGRLSHVVTQVVGVDPAPQRIAHIVVQVVQGLGTALPDMSGIYYVNPAKVTRHDSYYGLQERKIINPTIRTALLGE